MNPKDDTEKTLRTLDVRCCLKFYIDRTEQFRRSDQLLIAYGQIRKDLPIAKQGIAHWIASAIQFCHTKSGMPLSSNVRAHSTRGMSASTALFAGVPLEEICRVATWKSRHPFTRHYCLDSVGQAVLKNLFR